jgi:hypothetical protein
MNSYTLTLQTAQLCFHLLRLLCVLSQSLHRQVGAEILLIIIHTGCHIIAGLYHAIGLPVLVHQIAVP